MKEKYINEHLELMQEWLGSYQMTNKNTNFAVDGIIDPATWFSLGLEQERILILLKEAYDSTKNRIWDQTKWLTKRRCTDSCDKSFQCESCGATGYTFNTVAYWIHGIQQINNGRELEYDEHLNAGKDGFEATRNDLLKRCAIVNVKKTDGKSKTDEHELYYAVSKDEMFLKKQIEIINPTVIICGNTYGMLRCLYHEMEKLDNMSDGNTLFKGVKVIAACHPNRRSKQKDKFDLVVKNYKELLGKQLD